MSEVYSLLTVHERNPNAHNEAKSSLRRREDIFPVLALELAELSRAIEADPRAPEQYQ
jgi:hypothetical protein